MEKIKEYLLLFIVCYMIEFIIKRRCNSTKILNLISIVLGIGGVFIGYSLNFDSLIIFSMSIGTYSVLELRKIKKNKLE